MQLYYIRHGQSSNNALSGANAAERRTEDPELTAAGARQAVHLARYLSHNPAPVDTPPGDRQNVNGFGITYLYSSLMVRSLATAHAVAEALDLPVQAWEDLHEEWGIYLADEETGVKVGLPGKDRETLERRFPRLVWADGIREDGWWNRPPEPVEERIPRARRIVRDLLARHGGTDDRVALVSHGGTYQCVMGVLLGLPLAEDGYLAPEVRFSINNTGITRVDFTDRMRLAYSNRLEHLPRELVT